MVGAQQENPAARLSSIVGVSIEEYAKGIDDHGRLISNDEYKEAQGFLVEAASVAERLSGERGTQVRAVLDTLDAAMKAKQPPSALEPIHKRFMTALGSEGALALPTHPLDIAEGRSIYQQNCATCHGERGLGDGPSAKGMNPHPPAIGNADTMATQSPALLYRVISVGVPGTQMPAWGNTLTSQQRWNVVAYLHTLRATQAEVAEGEGLYLQRCASCHGATGGTDGALAQSFAQPPPEIGSFGWQVEKSDAQLAAAIRNGIAGTPMPASSELSDAQVRKIVAYLRTLPVTRADVPVVAAASDTDATRIARTVIATLDQSLAAAQAGRRTDAGDRAFDAYIAFEPLETHARAKSPGLVSSMERHFADFKGAIKANDLTGAQRVRDVIEAQMPSVVALTRPTSGGWEAFLESFLIILREGFEAILVVGAVVAFLLKTGHRDQLKSIWAGVGLGLAASAVTAVILRTALKAAPASSEIIEGVTLLIAVAVLFSVSYWLISKVEAAKWQQFIREKVTAALEQGGGKALAFVAFLAVYREGAETALFFQALFNEGSHLAIPLSLGILIGFVALAIVFTLFYRFGVRIPLRPFFAITGVLLYYMAFVFVGKGVRELQEGNAIPITMIHGLPHVEAMGIFPTVETMLAQLLLLALFVFALVKTFWPKRSVELPTVPAGTPATSLGDQLARLQQATALLEARVADLERETGSVTRDSGLGNGRVAADDEGTEAESEAAPPAVRRER
ncbi:MAG TPA: cytochrome c/FTR1 family iron permease [Gemmatimonadaceae bacterium]|nr:cytochrome c/FTR1 family iron permease [Gemmatimonadaceae bacterium]